MFVAALTLKHPPFFYFAPRSDLFARVQLLPQNQSMRCLILSCFFILSAIQASAASLAEEHLWPVLEKGTDKTSISILGAGVLATLVATPNDDYYRAHWKDYQHMDRPTAKFGDDLARYGIGPAIALTQYFFDRENGLSHVRALVYVTVLGGAMKLSFQRERPNHANKHSFPSGHTYSAFATATSLTYAYGWQAGVIAYPVATMIGLSRLADNYHWLSDVVAGAFLGYYVGRATFLEEKTESLSLWLPYLHNDIVGAQYVMNF